MATREIPVLGNSALSHFDAIVIGSGAGGSAVTNALCANGQSVLVLEAGSNYFEGLDQPSAPPATLYSTDELKLMRRNFIVPDSHVEPRTFRRDPGDGVRRFTGDVNPLPKTVGGGAVHADLKMPRFAPFDFELATQLGGPIAGADFADWPLSYGDLEPFYAYAERALGIQGDATAMPAPWAGPRSGPYPMPPGVPMYAGLRLFEAARSLGYHPIPYPTAVNSRPYGGRPPCIDCGYCSGYGCTISAKGSPAVTLLRAALLSGNCQLRPETRVTRLRTSASGTEIVGLDALGPNGESLTFTADRYVLAASPIEDARLLLLSDPGGPGLGNSSGRVGRDLLFHFQTIVTGVFDDRLHTHRGRTVTHGLPDFRGVPGDPTRPLGGIVEFAATQKPIEEALEYMERLALRGKGLKRLMHESPFRDRMVALIMQGEDAPQLTNQVDLDPSIRDLDGLPVARVTYKNHEYELSARDFYIPKLRDLLKAAGARYSIVAPIDEISSSGHVMGTLRFGKDPRDSVCDASGRLHDFGNCYAADGSLFPTSSGFNPTLTLVAVATRVGAAMVEPSNPAGAIPSFSQPEQRTGTRPPNSYP